MSFVEELRQGLEKTRKNFTERMEDLVGISVDLDEDFMDELEMILVAGDVGTVSYTHLTLPTNSRV